jgi:hypothetical protein
MSQFVRYCFHDIPLLWVNSDNGQIYNNVPTLQKGSSCIIRSWFVFMIKSSLLDPVSLISSEVICKYQNSEFDINERLNQCKSSKIGTNENKWHRSILLIFWPSSYNSLRQCTWKNISGLVYWHSLLISNLDFVSYCMLTLIIINT